MPQLLIAGALSPLMFVLGYFTAVAGHRLPIGGVVRRVAQLVYVVSFFGVLALQLYIAERSPVFCGRCFTHYILVPEGAIYVIIIVLAAWRESRRTDRGRPTDDDKSFNGNDQL